MSTTKKTERLLVDQDLKAQSAFLCHHVLHYMLKEDGIRLNGYVHNDEHDPPAMPCVTSAEFQGAYKVIKSNCMSMWSQYHDEMLSQVKTLDISGSKLQSNFLEVALTIIDGEIRWGRIMAVFVFTALLAVRLHSEGQQQKIDGLQQWLVMFINDNVLEWLQETQGGWKGLEKLASYKQVEDIIERLQKLVWAFIVAALFSGWSVVNQRMSFLYEYFKVVKLILLLRGGDVERNPGPRNPEPPTTQSITHELGPSYSKWMELGNALGVGFQDLQSIRMNELSVNIQCICMQDTWLRRNHHAKWEDLCIALREIGEDGLADQISQKYCEEVTHQPEQDVPRDDARPTTSTTHVNLAPLPQEPGIDWELEGLSEKEKFDLAGRFSQTIDGVADLLDEAVKPNNLKRFLSSHYHPTSKLPYVDMAVCKDKSTTSEILLALQPRFIHCTQLCLLKAVVEKYGCEASKKLLEEYEQSLPRIRSPRRKRACNQPPKETERTKRPKFSHH